MKTFLILFVTLYISATNAQSDTLNYNKIKINDRVNLEQSSEQVIADLGSSTERKPYYNEVEDVTMEQITIKGSKFYFLDNKMDDFEIISPFFFVYNSRIKVGNSIDSIKDVFPKSYLLKKESGNNGFINVQIFRDDIGLMDLYLLVTFDVNTKLINGISMWSPD